MARNNARQTLGYGQLPNFPLVGRPRSRTLGYNQLPNGELDPMALGAPLTLAPMPAPPAPPPPVASSSAPAALPFEPPTPPPTPPSERFWNMPVASLKRAADIARETHEAPAEAPRSTDPKHSSGVYARKPVSFAPAAVAPRQEPLRAPQAAALPVRAAPRSYRRVIVRAVVSLALVSGIAGVVYAGLGHEEALSAVAQWATLGQAK